MDYEKKLREIINSKCEYYPSEDKAVFAKYFPELKESKDERIRKGIIRNLQYLMDRSEGFVKEDLQERIAWLEKQGEFKSNKWTEGDVVRHGGVLALVTNGRKAMKSNCEQITILYPDEWVKAETKERKYFFDELEKQGEKRPTEDAKKLDADEVIAWLVANICDFEYYVKRFKEDFEL